MTLDQLLVTVNFRLRVFLTEYWENLQLYSSHGVTAILYKSVGLIYISMAYLVFRLMAKDR